MIAHQKAAEEGIQLVAGRDEPVSGDKAPDPNRLDRNRGHGASAPGTVGTPGEGPPKPGQEHHAIPTSTILGP